MIPKNHGVILKNHGVIPENHAMILTFCCVLLTFISHSSEFHLAHSRQILQLTLDKFMTLEASPLSNRASALSSAERGFDRMEYPRITAANSRKQSSRDMTGGASCFNGWLPLSAAYGIGLTELAKVKSG